MSLYSHMLTREGGVPFSLDMLSFYRPVSSVQSIRE